MPKGTRSITEAVKAVVTLKAELREIVAQIAKEKAEANKAKATATKP